MSLITEFNNLRQQIDSLSETLHERLFEDLTHEQPQLAMFSSGETPWMPAIELQETETALVLKAQLPGIEPSELDIQVSENAVFLSGEHQERHKTSEKGLFRSEFHYGQFKRVIPLPTSIHREQVTAAMVSGLLTLTMPKATPALPNLVKVSLVSEGLPSQSARQSAETAASDAKSAFAD